MIQCSNELISMAIVIATTGNIDFNVEIMTLISMAIVIAATGNINEVFAPHRGR